LEKAIEIKRRAQRFIQGGDLDGALAEYEKLVTLPDCDPYNFVLLADLLFKRGEMPNAIERYLTAASLYERAGLYKNAIAVCKKMMRLALAPAQVLEHLANLHALDGLTTEAALYYRQFAEHLVREQRGADAAVALRKAYAASPEEITLLEKAAEAHLLAEDSEGAASAFAEASLRYRQRAMLELAAASRDRAESLAPGAYDRYLSEYAPGELAGEPAPGELAGEPAASMTEDAGEGQGLQFESPFAGGEDDTASADRELAPPMPVAEPPAPVSTFRLVSDPRRPPAAEGLESGPSFTPPSLRLDPSRQAAPAPGADGDRPPSPARIEELLKLAQESMRNGDQETASGNLLEAARGYEACGRPDNAATIYRSVVRTSASPIPVLERWLANAERRDARHEAAEVACQLGDHAVQAGDLATAGDWFRHAAQLDANNATAQRRLKRLEPETPPPAGPPLQVAVEAPQPAAPSRVPVEAPEAAHDPVTAAAPKVEMAVGRAEAVSFDLGSLLGEFQRGIEAQLSGDAQGHYDLAMAYREMGLLDLAIESFRLALSSPMLAARAAEMLGRSLLDQGRFEDAARELTAALDRPGLEEDSVLGLRYLLGLAHEAAGETGAALTEFEFVFARQPSFQDVAQKMRDLRRATGS
jgi:tetratricopeptide (TPR) repeat protein